MFLWWRMCTTLLFKWSPRYVPLIIQFPQIQKLLSQILALKYLIPKCLNQISNIAFLTQPKNVMIKPFLDPRFGLVWSGSVQGNLGFGVPSSLDISSSQITYITVTINLWTPSYSNNPLFIYYNIRYVCLLVLVCS